MTEPAAFVRACAVSDVPEGGVISVVLNGDEIAIVRTEGEFFAIRDWCSHAAVPLSETPEGGRGLILIEALCDRVDIRNHPARGAMIHFERDLKPREKLAA